MRKNNTMMLNTMMNKFFFLLFISLISEIGYAQTIKFSFPDEANKKFSFYIPNGLKSDTIAQGTISITGQDQIKIPERYKGVAAMGVLDIVNGAKVNLILEEKEFSVSISGDRKYIFSDSKENDLLYNKSEGAMLGEHKGTYAQFYVNTATTLSEVSRLISNPNQGNLFQRTNVRLALVNNVDVDKLYYSKFWYFVIDGLLRLSIGQEGFANDMIKLLDKTKTEKVYVALVEDIITLTNQFGLDEAFDQILLHVRDSGRIEHPQGNIFDAFTMLKVRKGSIAPTIVGLQTSDAIYDYSLIIFHQAGCDYCQEQLRLLNESVTFLRDRKVRIVSVSGDMDMADFAKESEEFRWKDKLCDYKGFGGENFLNFGVVATPTLYLLDSNNLVLGRFGTVLDIKKYLLEAF